MGRSAAGIKFVVPPTSMCNECLRKFSARTMPAAIRLLNRHMVAIHNIAEERLKHHINQHEGVVMSEGDTVHPTEKMILAMHKERSRSTHNLIKRE
jgi:hypothetical protein